MLLDYQALICISLADNDDNGGINDAVDGVGVGVGVDDAVDKLLHLGESWIWRTENCTNFAKLNNCTNGTR